MSSSRSRSRNRSRRTSSFVARTDNQGPPGFSALGDGSAAPALKYTTLPPELDAGTRVGRDSLTVAGGPSGRVSSGGLRSRGSGRGKRNSPLVLIVALVLGLLCVAGALALAFVLGASSATTVSSNSQGGDPTGAPTVVPPTLPPSTSPTSPTYPIILSATAEDVTDTEFYVRFVLDRKSSGAVEFGRTTAYGSSTVKEQSFSYAEHRQPVRGLCPDTLYHWRVVELEDTQGNRAPPGPDQTTRTAPGPTVDQNCQPGSAPSPMAPSPSAPTPPPTMALNGVTFASFGAVGDGVADDSSAIQAALDAEPVLTGSPGAVYRITRQLDFDRVGDTTIDWMGSTVTVTGVLRQAMLVKKPSGILSMSNLLIDGNKLLAIGMRMESGFNLNNVDVHDLYSSTNQAFAFYVRVSDTALFSQAALTDCDCLNINSLGNTVIGDTRGVSRCLMMYWYATSPAMTMSVRGGTWSGVWGDDGDLVHIDQPDKMWNHPSKLIFDGTMFGGFSRRAVKARASNLHFLNCIFTPAAKNDPNLTGTPSAGCLVLAVFSDPGKFSTGHVIRNCTFNGGYDGRIIPTDVDGLTISDSTFNAGTSLAFYQRVGDVRICNTKFLGGSTIYGYGSGQVTYSGEIEIGTNVQGGNGFNKLAQNEWKSVTCV